MIVLFSYNGDKNTNYVIEWLQFYKCNYKRVDLEDEDFRNIRVSISNNTTNIELKLHSGDTIDFSECDYFFVRGVGFSKPKINNSITLPDKVFNYYIENEFESLTKFFYSEVNKKSVGAFYDDSHLKLKQLSIAKKVGLSICNTLITNNKQDLLKTYNYSKTVTKAIEDNIGIEYDGRLICQRVQKVDYTLVEDLFFPSFFQNEINKEYEIRTFYLNGKCYSISFSSNSENIDMRDNYEISKYDRYTLPEDIERKIIKLMDKLNLVCGSLDFIKSTNGTYYFIEINLNGQYDWVSHFGGYNLHEKIARFLNSKTKN